MALPIGDLSKSRRIPVCTITLIAANVAVWLAYELPSGVAHTANQAGFHACVLDGSCADAGLPWTLDTLTSMFLHGSWTHLVGNMVFLAVFGPLVEERLGSLRFVTLYLLAGLAATAADAGAILAFRPGDATLAGIGASGAISGVLAAYVVLLPFRRILVWIPPVVFIRTPAIALIGVWFLLQALEGSLALITPDVHTGVAFFAHVGGFVFGLLAATAMLDDAWTRRALRHP
jgi:membrane associated rhomboid family serine protease